MSKENQKTTSDFDALDPRERGCSPLSDPEGLSKPKMLAASLNAFLGFSVYGSADGVTLSQNFTFSKGVKSAAKQQIGETRKKR